MQSKKLYRSRTDRSLGGVCGGLGDYFDIDSTIIRLIFVLAFLFAGTGPLVYIILWLVIPDAPDGVVNYQTPVDPDVVIETEENE